MHTVRIRNAMALLRQIALLGHPVLRASASPVPLPAWDPIRTLVDDMLATLRDANGVGIAAPQVYESATIFIVASRPNPRYPDAPLMEPETVINPAIIERSSEIEKGWEGCLSIPGIRGNVPRHSWIRARYQTLNGDEIERDFTGFVARIFQHEDDHLRGIVFLDRLESTRDVISEKEYQVHPAEARAGVEKSGHADSTWSCVLGLQTGRSACPRAGHDTVFKS
jgi:peptide deformylase